MKAFGLNRNPAVDEPGVLAWPGGARGGAAIRSGEAAGRDSVALRVTRVVKGFGGTPVLRGLDLEVSAGQFVSIVGRSGCGKSTLLRLVAALDRPDSGTIGIGGETPGRGAGAIRMMFQDARLLPWRTVLENVGLALPSPWQERAHAALVEVGLEEHAAKWPAQLSGGQRQRVALARALIHRPRLLLLDEPLGALDALTRLEMQGLIAEIHARHGFTVLLVTHDVEEAIALGDRAIVLDGGTIALDVDIDLARPRQRSAPAFTALEDAVLQRVLASSGKGGGQVTGIERHEP